MAPSGGITCKELVELVTVYLEGRLSPADLARFEEHLSVCPGCRTYVEQIRQTIRLLGLIDEEAISAEAENTLLRAFRTWKADR